MEWSALILVGVLSLFLFLNLRMLLSLLRPGDERNQVIVWKASSFTLFALLGATLIKVIEKLLRAKPMHQNPLVLLVVASIVYFASLLYYKRKHGG